MAGAGDSKTEDWGATVRVARGAPAAAGGNPTPAFDGTVKVSRGAAIRDDGTVRLRPPAVVHAAFAVRPLPFHPLNTMGGRTSTVSPTLAVCTFSQSTSEDITEISILTSV